MEHTDTDIPEGIGQKDLTMTQWILNFGRIADGLYSYVRMLMELVIAPC